MTTMETKKDKQEEQREEPLLEKYSVEDLENMSNEELKKLNVRLTDMLGIKPEREKELDEIIQSISRGERYDRISLTLRDIKDRENMTLLEKLYVCYAFGAVQGKLSAQAPLEEMLKGILGG